MKAETKPETQEEQLERWRAATRIPEAARYDHNVLQEQYVRIPGDLAYYASKAARAAFLAGQAKVKKKRVESQVYVELRERWPAGKTDEGVPVTEAYLAAKVELDERVVEATDAWLRADYEAVQLSFTVDTIQEKAHSLQGLGAGVRKEMTPNPVTRSPEPPKF